MKNVISFLMEAGKLKSVKRRGWVIDGVTDSESVSDHSWRAALMVMVFGKNKNINIEKALKMAIIHDIHEVLSGDIVLVDIMKYGQNKYQPKEMFDDISKEEKQKREEKAAKEMLSDELFQLWEECEKGKTKEAKFVKETEILEMSFQALEYELEKNHKIKDLAHYYKCSRDRINDPELLKILDEIEKMRPKGL